MVTIDLTDQEVVVHVRGWHKLHAMRSTLRVPLTHVTGVRANPVEANFDDAITESWRGLGTYTPHKLAAGVVYLADGPSFFDVQNGERTIAIDLAHERYSHLVVELENELPEHAALRIQHAVSSLRTGTPVLSH